MEFDESNNYGCPQEVVDILRGYVEKRLEPGSFVRAVLENDLMEAVFQADAVNLHCLYSICMYVYWEIPAECCGSKERVDRWLEKDKGLKNGK